MLTPKQLSRLFDHTLLKADATQKMVEELCAEAREHNFFSVCVNSSYVDLCARLLEGSQTIPISVVGFPLGANTIATKVFETQQAIDAGAREIDTVINLGALQSGSESYVRKDVAKVVEAAGKHNIPVKVILETGYLSDDLIKKLCVWCASEGAKFVKTSTGFGPRGATVKDIELMRSALQEINQFGKVAIKASGGIKDLAFVEQLVAAGAARIGASASVKILREAVSGGSKMEMPTKEKESGY